MKDLELDEVLQTGIDEIDDDHGRLVELFNLLNHAVTEDVSPDYLAAILEELVNCTVWHFSHEERLMLKYGYEDYAGHREEHQALIAAVREFQQKVLRAGNVISNEDLEYLEGWLTGHILSYDMKLGASLAETM